jgi:uncharacterized protein YjbJ (UPF0337 family)
MVDRNRIRGSARKVTGDVKKSAGRALGDRKLQTEGSADRVRGKARNALGSASDAMRGGNGRTRPAAGRRAP